MRKKLFTSLLITGLAISCMTGCQNNASTQDTQKQEQGQSQDTTETNDDSASTQTDNCMFTCSLCETEKICGIYTAEGKEYVVCKDCSNEFITAHEEIADKQICTSCEQEKICGTYNVDGTDYVVCPDDFDEFAHAMSLVEE